MKQVLFVCMGNICRSPTADGVFRKMLSDQDDISCDSAGTDAWHIGESPDSRTAATARRRGYDLTQLRARQVTNEDFELFDLVLAMDRSNLSKLQRMCPENLQHKVELFLNGTSQEEDEVPDPYFGGNGGFDHVMDLVEDGCRSLLTRLRQ
ncbi:low molecular weight protein-tyrosine-phosphatase [Pelagibaculum spongiae]|uniref:protein-tyrosine-phosphatase n=1 Tax=Pelagibaculum spongiae TaxID=2080658 RepID=A0A2V1GW86_9GAMM|nr:low molecular weight protein-tyrosine-phosphatase [Pelagibaculum spongiae]PVZ68927.1 protein-tyrosine-phosphatase [Pelagibaculum spongiae]